MRALILLAVVASFAAKAADKPKLLVLELGAGAGVDAPLASAITESVSSAVARQSYFQAVTSKDMQTLLGLERQRQMVGCADAASSCMAELAGALGARYVLSGSLSKVGDAFQLSLQMLDSTRGQSLGRSLRFARSLDAIRSIAPYAVAEATGTPAPAPPSKLLPYLTIGGGGLVLVGAAGLGIATFAEGYSTAQQLKTAQSTGVGLVSASQYADENRRLIGQQIGAWVLAGVGAAAVAGGIYWLSRLDTGAASVALIPSTNGFALAGVWR